ncbi:MAG: agmatine deiminase [Lachnospiraceae bacterium]|nr:agmatine deiminase [Lachnospiraceae bacterium]
MKMSKTEMLNNKINQYNLKDAFIMPGEFEQHFGCIMIWPVRPGSWIYEGRDAKKTFCEIANAIGADEKLFMLADKEHVKEAKQMLSKCGNYENMQVLEIASDDAWARDVGPTFVRNREGEVQGISWTFNAWGGTYDGLYAHWEKDDLVAKELCRQLDYPCVDATPFVLEGGSVHTDGEGTIITTEACLLSPGRNPSMTKEEIEQALCNYLGGEKVIWLPHGIYGDETNEHVDNVCAFVKPGTVVLAWTDDENDPQYAYSKEAYGVLCNEKDAKGRTLEVIKLPIPRKPVCITKEECEGFVFEEGEDIRQAGERLAASYVNFYISNHSIILPQFGDENDGLAVQLMEHAFPDRKIVPVMARSVIVGGGNIHCITQQIPL